VISGDVRRAIARAVAAEGLGAADPGLRPTGTPGQYASTIAFASGEQPRSAATRIAARLADTAGIARAEVTGPGFIAITVTAEALAELPDRIIAAGPASAASDALAGLAIPAPPAADPFAEASWEGARAALAGQLTAGLAAAAGAAVAPQEPPASHRPQPREIAHAVAYAGADAVRFSLARALPGRPVVIDPEIIARHVLGNPAYAVRYAHARAASGVRWAANSRPVTLGRPAVPRHPLAHQAEMVLLDALSWLPERVAIAARRGRPDEFARYLEELARATIAALICDGYPSNARVPGTDRLVMARAARTGLAAGLGLLGVGAPDRL
jgi:arginyl-tRNA synthetase